MKKVLNGETNKRKNLKRDIIKSKKIEKRAKRKRTDVGKKHLTKGNVSTTKILKFKMPE